MAAQEVPAQGQVEPVITQPTGNLAPPPVVGTGEAQPGAPPPPTPKRKLPRILPILGGVLVVLVLVFLVVRVLLPRFMGEEETTLVWWGLWEEETIVSPLIAEYQKTHPDVKIQYIKQSPQDYRERLTNALAKGNGPDIFRFHNTWVPLFREELDFVPASVMNPSDYTQTFYPVASSDLTSGAGFVGIPLEYDGLTLFINEDIFASAGKVAPETWDDLRQTAIQLTAKDENGAITQAGVALGRTENVDHWPEILALMMVQNGVNLENPSGKLAEDALTFFTVFSAVDGVWDETLPPSTTAFSSGKAAMYFGPSWRAFEITQQNPNLNFRTYPLPQLPKANPNQPDIAYATYWAEGVWARSSQKDAAWEFLAFLSTRNSLQKLYQNAAKVRSFGEPYSRVDMADLLLDHPVLGAIVSQAPDARSWYLASRTFDGPSGINSQVIKYFEDAVNAVNTGTRADKALETAAAGISQVLTQYGLVSR